MPTLVADRDRRLAGDAQPAVERREFCDKEHGLVEIRLWRDARALRVDVRDNGLGISAENQQIIFEKFRQVATR